jgi:uncharacterized protein Veg
MLLKNGIKEAYPSTFVVGYQEKHYNDKEDNPELVEPAGSL